MFEKIINLIYPTVCGICGEIAREDICNKCKVKLKKWKRNKKHIYLTKNFSTHIYLFDYHEEIRQKILEYKFKEKTYLYRSFAKIIVNDKKICGFLKSYDIIIPVPISKARYKKRGYNQSLLISREISKKLPIDIVNNCLFKTKSHSLK